MLQSSVWPLMSFLDRPSFVSALNARGPFQCLVSASLLLLLATFPEFAGTHVSSGPHHHPSSHNNDNNIYIQSNISLQQNNHHYYYHHHTGKRTMSFDYEDPLGSPKWQWVLKPSRRTSSHRSPHERPVRHWWANLARPHHQQVSHSKRSAPSSAMATLTTDYTTHVHNNSSQPLSNSGPLYECLDHQWPGLETPYIMTHHGAIEWMDRVCSANSLDQRVRELLSALWSCPQHRVCQILSPEELRNLSDNKLCRHEASKLWTRFRNIFLVIRDFSDVFQEKFDTADYSVIFNSNQCQVGIVICYL